MFRNIVSFRFSQGAKSVAIGCSVGAAACVVLAIGLPIWIAFSSEFAVIFGSLVGFLVGYFACDFSRTLAAVPEAGQAASDITGTKISIAFNWVRKRPADEHAFAVTFPFVSVLILYLLSPAQVRTSDPNLLATLILFLILGTLMILCAAVTTAAIIGLSIHLGAKKKKWHLVDPNNHRNEYGYKYDEQVVLNHRTIFLCYGLGLWIALRYCLFLFIPLLFFRYLPKLLLWLGIFIKHMFIYVHSNRNLLCGLYGTLGGLTAVWCYYTVANPSSQSFAAWALLGGVIGMTLGVANWELISIRWLKLAPARQQS